MKAICIDASTEDITHPVLTLNKYYEIKKLIQDDRCQIIDDDNINWNCYLSRFKLVEDIREDKLKELGL